MDGSRPERGQEGRRRWDVDPKSSQKYGMSFYTLQMEVQGERDHSGHSGVKPLLSQEVETDVAALMRAMARAGFGVAKKDIPEIIRHFCEAHEIEVPESFPSKIYVAQFCGRHNFTLRKEAMISQSRKEATANPFNIYPFYDLKRT